MRTLRKKIVTLFLLINRLTKISYRHGKSAGLNKIVLSKFCVCTGIDSVLTTQRLNLMRATDFLKVASYSEMI